MKFLKNKLSSPIYEFSNNETQDVINKGLLLLGNLKKSLELLEEDDYDEFMLLEDLDSLFDYSDFRVLNDVVNSGSARGYVGGHLRASMFYLKKLCDGINKSVEYYIPLSDEDKDFLVSTSRKCLSDITHWMYYTFDFDKSIDSNFEEVDFNIYNNFPDNKFKDVINNTNNVRVELPADLCVFEENPELEYVFYDKLTMNIQDIQFLDFLLDIELVNNFLEDRIGEEALYKELLRRSAECSID